MNYNEIIDYFKDEYSKIGDKDRAINEKIYLKSPFKFYGVSVGDSRKIAIRYFKRFKDISKKDIWILVDMFWNSGYHELRRTAIHLLIYYKNKLDIEDIVNVEKLLETSTNWDQVDEICGHIMDVILHKNWIKTKPYLEKWNREQNFWMRRSSLLSQLLILRSKNSEVQLYEKAKNLFFKLSENLLVESKYSDKYYITDIMPKNMGKFFIRKAIGWILRDMSKFHPQDVIFYVNKNKYIMSGLSYREAIKNLSLENKNQLL